MRAPLLPGGLPMTPRGRPPPAEAGALACICVSVKVYTSFYTCSIVDIDRETPPTREHRVVLGGRWRCLYNSSTACKHKGPSHRTLAAHKRRGHQRRARKQTSGRAVHSHGGRRPRRYARAETDTLADDDGRGTREDANNIYRIVTRTETQTRG